MGHPGGGKSHVAVHLDAVAGAVALAAALPAEEGVAAPVCVGKSRVFALDDVVVFDNVAEAVVKGDDPVVRHLTAAGDEALGLSVFVVDALIVQCTVDDDLAVIRHRRARLDRERTALGYSKRAALRDGERGTRRYDGAVRGLRAALYRAGRAVEHDVVRGVDAS